MEAGIVEVEFGEGVTVVKPVNLYGCRIADACFIGPFVEVQSDVEARVLPEEPGGLGEPRAHRQDLDRAHHPIGVAPDVRGVRGP